MNPISKPFALVHVDVTRIATTDLPPAPAAVYFWFRDYPIGHLWLDRGDQCANMPAAALEAVDEVALERARRGDLDPPGPAKLRTSVIICTRDRPNDLRRCLDALAAQIRPADQIVVVDNSPRTDASQAVALEMGVDYVREPRPGLDVARNTGVRSATGEIILFTDDDVEVQPAWLVRMTAAFDAPALGCVTGLVLPAELQTDAQQHFERYWSFSRGYRRIDFGQHFYALNARHGCPAWEIGAGASMAFRREVFRRVGGFDERLDAGAAGCSGDSEFWYRLLGDNWTCRYEPAAVAFHYHRKSMAELRKQIRSYMRGHAAALMVQFEHSRHRGNLFRAFVTLPMYYCRRFVHRMIFGSIEQDLLLEQEILGYVAGLWFYICRFRSPSNSGVIQER